MFFRNEGPGPGQPYPGDPNEPEEGNALRDLDPQQKV